MAAAKLDKNLKQLYLLAPGFARDKDEDWLSYLPQSDQIYMRKSRGEFIVMKDQLDELKSEQKEYLTGTAKHKELGLQVVELTTEVDSMIKSLLSRIPALKQKGLRARDAAIDTDFSCPTRKRHAAELSNSSYGSVATPFDAYLPSHLIQPKPTEQPQPEIRQQTTPTTQKTPAGQSAGEQPARNTYYDGVADCDLGIMKKLRPIVEKFDCKDRVLETLRRFRERDDRLETLKDINAMVGKA